MSGFFSKLCSSHWLCLVGLALSLVVSCGGGDAGTPASVRGGAGGAAGRAGSAAIEMGGAPEAGGAPDQYTIPCSCVSEGGAGGGVSVCEAGLEVVRNACSRGLAEMNYVELTGGVCEPGTRLYHNKVYDPGATITRTEAPLDANSDEVETCVESVFDTPGYTWEEQITDYFCWGDSIWECGDDGLWGSNCDPVSPQDPLTPQPLCSN
jgi:hypothetical protein